MSDRLTSRVRKTGVPDLSDGTEGSLAISRRGDLFVAQGLPERTELVRLGNSWTARIASASAFTLVNALPTTRGEIVLYNGEAAGGKSYVIDSVFYHGITSMGVIQPVALVGQLVPASTMVAPTHSATTTLIDSLSGKPAYDGLAKRAVAVTTAFANYWSVLAQGNATGATTNLGHSIVADLYGKYVVPPGAGFLVAGIGGTAAGTGIIGIAWHEILLNVNP